MHPQLLKILTSLSHDKVIKGEEILPFIRQGGDLLDRRLKYLLELKYGYYAHIVFTGLDPYLIHPKDNNPPVGEFLPVHDGDHLGVIFIHETENMQETLAHEVFHALEDLAIRQDEGLILEGVELWEKSNFPTDHYASWGGPGEGPAEVWRAHLGHYEDEEEEVLWVLEDEWADYFDKVVSHCFFGS